MIKITGLLAMVLSFGLAGMGLSENLRERIRLLEDMQNMINEVKGRMHYFREPIFQIFQNLEKKGNSRAFSLPIESFTTFCEKGGEIADLWVQTVEEIYGNVPLTKEDREIIAYIGTYLGQSDYENQLMQFQCTEERLARQLEYAREEYQQKGTMYRKAGFFTGVLAAIILL